MKGQKARGATKIRPAIRDLIKRTPKLRGEEFPSLPSRPTAAIVNVGALKSRFADGAVVTPKTLAAVKMLPSAKHPAKLLGGGEPPKKLLVRGVAVSKSAREKIENAGGTIQSTTNDRQPTTANVSSRRKRPS